MSSSTRLSSIQCEGSHGELLKITSKHTILLPAGGIQAQTADKDDRAATILPPSNGLIPVMLQLRVNRKLVPALDLQRSGFLEAVVSFLNQVSRDAIVSCFVLVA